jgi:hypothetical protein
MVIVPTNVELALKYRTEYRGGNSGGGGGPGPTTAHWEGGSFTFPGRASSPMFGPGRVYDSTDTKYTELTATIACIDLNSMSVVFREIYRKKKDNSNFLQFTDADKRNAMIELDNSLVSKVYDEALKSILKELQKNDK